MSAEVKVLSTNTRTNLEALKHHMKKLGFIKSSESDSNWITFEKSNGDFEIKRIHIFIRGISYTIDYLSLDRTKSDELAEINQAILNFYKAEGITDEN